MGSSIEIGGISIALTGISDLLDTSDFSHFSHIGGISQPPHT